MDDDHDAVWFDAVESELGLEPAGDAAQVRGSVDELADLVARHVDPSVGPRTTFLVGMAAGRAADPSVAAHDFADKLSALARGWNDDRRGSAEGGVQERHG